MASSFLTRNGNALCLASVALILGGCVSPTHGSLDCRTQEQTGTLAESMASMEVHLNHLFRQFGQGVIDAQSEASVTALLDLQKKSATMVPKAWCDLPKSERESKISHYRFRALQMVELLEGFLACVRGRDLDLAQEWLQTIDQQRRECHVRFG